MADVVNITWLYPPNWDGSYPGGGANPNVQPYGWKRMSVQFEGFLSTGTGESLVRKLVVGDLQGIQGNPCTKIGISRIKYVTWGVSVQLYWDMNPNQLVFNAPESSQGTVEGPYYPDLVDGAYGELETGDLLLSTTGHSANDTYNLQLDIIVKE